MVGERVVRAIRNREFYVFTHMHTRDWLLARHQRIIAAFDECEKWIAERAGCHSGRRAARAGIHEHKILNDTRPCNTH